MGNIIALNYIKNDGSFDTVGFTPTKDGHGAKLFIDGKEEVNFIIVDESFTPVLTMIEKSNQDIYVDSYAPLNQTPRANVYTKSDHEQIPVGTISSEITPSIDNIIIVFEDMIARGDAQTPEGSIAQPRTYFRFKKLGRIVTVDAR